MKRATPLPQNIDKNGSVTALSDKLIETVNIRLLKMFGNNKSELIGNFLF
jgi:hypothetical protein